MSGEAQGRRATDGIAEKNGAFEAERIHCRQRDAFVMGGSGVHAVERREPLPRPV